MSLFTKLFEAVHSWRRRRGGTKPRKRSDLGMEQLDHRQLLAVNFTGNVPIDFPATESPGVVVVKPTNGNTTPLVPTILNGQPVPGTLAASGAIPGNVVGTEIDSVSISYDLSTDILSVGVQGPDNAQTGQEVIAGDSDNNLNSGTVNPSVLPFEPAFTDPPDMGGTKTFAITLSFNGSQVPQVVAGFPRDNPPGVPASQSKIFTVAGAIPNPNNSTGEPTFNDSELFPQYTGSYFLANDPNHPNFEFQIDHFSQLYQQMSGKPLSATSTIGIGGFASTAVNTGISDELFQIVTGISIADASVPTTPPPPPPPPPPISECSPTIYVNYHEDNHVNTAHPTAIRVSVLGSSGFDPTTIIPSTVRFGNPSTIETNGATPILNFESNVNHDEFPDETFVFNGLDVTLPSGVTTAEITGETTSGMFFNSQVKVFNRDYSYYTSSQISKQQASWLAYDKKNGIDTSSGAVAPPPVIPKAAQQRAASAAIDDLYGPLANKPIPKQVNPSLGTAQAASVTPAPVVSIPTKNKSKTGQTVTLTSVNMGSQSAAGSLSLVGSS